MPCWIRVEIRMRLKAAWMLLLCVLANHAAAQLSDPDPDWHEVDVPAPPAVRTDRLIPLELPRYLSVKVGIDANSLQIGSGGVVRYVAVATSPSGNLNASYEGIRCQTGEVKVYARHGSTGTWTPEENPEWQPLRGKQPSLHALAFSHQGACIGRSIDARSPAEILARMKYSKQDNR